MTANKKDREDLYMRRCGLTREEVHNLFRMGEKYEMEYGAQEALKLRLIDKIDMDFKFWGPPAVAPAAAK